MKQVLEAMFHLLDIQKKYDFDKICDVALKELDRAKDGRISKSNIFLIFFQLYDLSESFQNTLLIIIFIMIFTSLEAKNLLDYTAKLRSEMSN